MTTTAHLYRPLGYRVPSDLQPLLDAYQELYAEYEPADARYLQVHRWHLMKLRSEEEPFATSDLIQRLTFSGSIEPLREGIRSLREAGFSQFAVHIRFGQDAMLEEWADLLSGI